MKNILLIFLTSLILLSCRKEGDENTQQCQESFLSISKWKFYAYYENDSGGTFYESIYQGEDLILQLNENIQYMYR